MKHPEDPCRDPASEARDDWEQLCQPLTNEERRENARKIEALSVPDRFALMFSNASEPRATPETDVITFDPYPWNQNGPGRSHYPEVMCQCEDGEWVKADFARRLERQRDELLEALVPFAHYITVMEAMGGTTPKSGPVWGCHSSTGDAEISVEDMQKARAAIAAVKGGTP